MLMIVIVKNGVETMGDCPQFISSDQLLKIELWTLIIHDGCRALVVLAVVGSCTWQMADGCWPIVCSPGG